MYIKNRAHAHKIGRRGEETWRELLARQVRSGLSVPAFCRQERPNEKTFYGWRSKLRGRLAASATTAECNASEPDPRAGFIDLGTVGSGPPRCEIPLDLGGGVVLQVVRG